MQAWSSALASELAQWPQLSQKSFFGLTALYRGKTMFGLLPRTCGIFQGNSVAFRLNPAPSNFRSAVKNDPRIAAFDREKTRWFTFTLTSGADLHDALDYLGRAYAAVRTRKKTK
jgi:hypothetical protein